jgi:hypothetical protein
MDEVAQAEVVAAGMIHLMPLLELPIQAVVVAVLVALMALQMELLVVAVSSSFATQTRSNLQHLQLAHQQLQQRVVLEFISGRVQARLRSNHGSNRDKTSRA